MRATKARKPAAAQAVMDSIRDQTGKGKEKSGLIELPPPPTGEPLPAPRAKANQVLTAAEVEDMENRKQIQSLAQEVITSTVRQGVATINLCEFLRGKGKGNLAIAPAMAREELLKAGLHKAFVSEVIKVSSVSDELWNKYASAAIGFKKVLEIARGNVQKLLAAESGGTEGEVEEGLAEAGLTEAEHGDKGKTAGVSSDEVSTKRNGMAASAKSILKAAERLVVLKQKPKQIAHKWTLGNGWVLELKKEKIVVEGADDLGEPAA